MPTFEPLQGELILNDRTGEQMDALIRRVQQADQLLSNVQSRLNTLGSGMSIGTVNIGADQFERLQKAIDAIDVAKLKVVREALAGLGQAQVRIDASDIETIAKGLDAAAAAANKHADATTRAATAQKALNDEVARSASSRGTFSPTGRMKLSEDPDPSTLLADSTIGTPITKPETLPDPVKIAQVLPAVQALTEAQVKQAEATEKAAQAQKKANEELQRASAASASSAVATVDQLQQDTSRAEALARDAKAIHAAMFDATVQAPGASMPTFEAVRTDNSTVRVSRGAPLPDPDVGTLKTDAGYIGLETVSRIMADNKVIWDREAQVIEGVANAAEKAGASAAESNKTAAAAAQTVQSAAGVAGTATADDIKKFLDIANTRLQFYRNEAHSDVTGENPRLSANINGHVYGIPRDIPRFDESGMIPYGLEGKKAPLSDVYGIWSGEGGEKIIWERGMQAGQQIAGYMQQAAEQAKVAAGEITLPFKSSATSGDAITDEMSKALRLFDSQLPSQDLLSTQVRVARMDDGNIERLADIGTINTGNGTLRMANGQDINASTVAALISNGIVVWEKAAEAGEVLKDAEEAAAQNASQAAAAATGVTSSPPPPPTLPPTPPTPPGGGPNSIPGAQGAAAGAGAMGNQGAAAAGNTTTRIEQLLMGLIQGLSFGSMELVKRNQFIQQNPVVGAGVNLLQGSQFLGMSAAALGPGSGIGGVLSTLGSMSSISGTVVTSIGVVIAAFNKLNDSFADIERLNPIIEKIEKKFGDMGTAVERVQARIHDAASENDIRGILSAVSKTGIFTDIEKLGDLAEVAQRKAFFLGKSWQETMMLIQEAIEAGDGKTLKDLDLIKSPNKALLDYAEAAGKLVPQLNEVEIQQALFNATMEEGSELMDRPVSDAESLIVSYDKLRAGINDVQGAFSEWISALLAPDSSSAANFWGTFIDELAAKASASGDAMQAAANEIRAQQKAQDTGQTEQLDALIRVRDQARHELTQKQNENNLFATGEDRLPLSVQVQRYPNMEKEADAYIKANADLQQGVNTLLNGGSIAEMPAVKLEMAKQQLKDINAEIERLAQGGPANLVSEDTARDLQTAKDVLSAFDDASMKAMDPEQYNEAVERLNEARRKFDAEMLANGSVADRTAELVTQRTEIEAQIAELERLAMTPGQRLEADKKSLQEVLREIEETKRRIAADTQAVVGTRGDARALGQLGEDNAKLAELEAQQQKLIATPGVLTAYNQGQAMEEAGSAGLYGKLSSASLDPTIAAMKIDKTGGKDVAAIMDELAASSEALVTAQERLRAVEGGGDATAKSEAKADEELAIARQNSAVAAAQLAAATIKLNEARASGDSRTIQDAESELALAEANAENAKSAGEAAYSKANIADLTAAAAAAQQKYNAAVASGSEVFKASAKAEYDSAQAKLAAAVAAQGLTTGLTSVTNVAGQMFDRVSGLPVAFDAAAMGSLAYQIALDNVKMKMQEVIAQAGAMSMQLGASLIPYLGLEGGLAKGKEWAQQTDELGTRVYHMVSEHGMDEDVGGMIMNAGKMIQANDQQKERQKFTDMANGANQAERNVKALNNALDGLARGILKDSTKGLLDMDKLFGREDEVDEKARRMADVAVKGFGSPWFESLKGLFPEDVLEKGAKAVKDYALKMVRDHQNGLTTIFYDTEMAADKVIENIQAKANQEKLIAEVRDKVKAKLGEGGAGMTDEEIMQALGIDTTPQAMSRIADTIQLTYQGLVDQVDKLDKDADKGGLVLSMTEVPEEQVSTVQENGKKVGVLVGDAYALQLKDGGYVATGIANINACLEEKKGDIEASGRTTAIWWGSAFATEISLNVPPALLSILVTELIPLMRDAQAKEQERNGGGNPAI